MFLNCGCQLRIIIDQASRIGTLQQNRRYVALGEVDFAHVAYYVHFQTEGVQTRLDDGQRLRVGAF